MHSVISFKNFVVSRSPSTGLGHSLMAALSSCRIEWRGLGGHPADKNYAYSYYHSARLLSILWMDFEEGWTGQDITVIGHREVEGYATLSEHHRSGCLNCLGSHSTTSMISLTGCPQRLGSSDRARESFAYVVSTRAAGSTVHFWFHERPGAP